MSYRVRTASRAEADIEAIRAWIATHESRPLSAARWLDGLELALASLKEHPLRCPRAPEAAFLEQDIRQLLYHSHRILFVVKGTRFWCSMCGTAAGVPPNRRTSASESRPYSPNSSIFFLSVG